MKKGEAEMCQNAVANFLISINRPEDHRYIVDQYIPQF